MVSVRIMSAQSQLLAEIEAFLRTRKIAATTFGKLAVNDGKFVGRMREGGNLTVKTIDRVREYIRTQKANGDRQP
jgi:hypothetical protein